MDLAIRAIVAFLFIFLLTRVIGRRELSSLEPFDLILLIVIGDLVQQGVTQSDQSLMGAVIVLSVISLMTVGVAYLNFRFRSLRPVLEGRPVVLIENGNLIRRNLRRERLTIEEVESEARLAQLESIDAVRLAVLETNGKISFIPKQDGAS
jgi:uncharacterized membrane protein YcaP (DUF421 family)